jgi:hypothetical protein
VPSRHRSVTARWGRARSPSALDRPEQGVCSAAALWLLVLALAYNGGIGAGDVRLGAHLGLAGLPVVLTEPMALPRAASTGENRCGARSAERGSGRSHPPSGAAPPVGGVCERHGRGVTGPGRGGAVHDRCWSHATALAGALVCVGGRSCGAGWPGPRVGCPGTGVWRGRRHVQPDTPRVARHPRPVGGAGAARGLRSILFIGTIAFFIIGALAAITLAALGLPGEAACSSGSGPRAPAAAARRSSCWRDTSR